MPLQILWLAAAGALGTLSRYGLSTLVQRWTGSHFAYGTLLVNALGCLLFGAVWRWTEVRLGLGANTRLIVLTGFMGAFTTFSTFAFDSYLYAHESRWLLAVANIVSQNVLGILCVLAGVRIVEFGFWVWD